MDATYMELMVRLTLAMVLGGAIGIEREYRAKEAGFRTHFLVALGSALFCVVVMFHTTRIKTKQQKPLTNPYFFQ